MGLKVGKKELWPEAYSGQSFHNGVIRAGKAEHLQKWSAK